MRRLAATAALLLLGSGGFLARQEPTFRSNVQTVAVYATARDKQGHLVTDLAASDFVVRDNGREVPVTVFFNEIQPITAVALLDMSLSMTDRLPRVRMAVGDFIASLTPRDRLRIGSFGLEVSLSPYLTSDQAVLKRVVQSELWPGGQTPLWRAIDASMTSLAQEPGRRVILVLTDGDDYSSGRSGIPGPPGGVGRLKDRLAAAANDMVYAIGFIDAYGSGRLQGNIVNLTDISGGGHFDVRESDDLSATFAEVADELRHQYTLGFTPAALDNRQHDLRVSARRPGVAVRARTTYFAGSDR